MTRPAHTHAWFSNHAARIAKHNQNSQVQHKHMLRSTSTEGRVNADGLNVSYLPDTSRCTSPPPQGEPPICQRENDGSSPSFNKAILRGLVCISHPPGSQRSATRRPAASSNTPGPGKKADTAQILLEIQAINLLERRVFFLLAGGNIKFLFRLLDTAVVWLWWRRCSDLKLFLHFILFLKQPRAKNYTFISNNFFECS